MFYIYVRILLYVFDSPRDRGCSCLSEIKAGQTPREDLYRPYGTGWDVPTFPRAYALGYHIPPLPGLQSGSLSRRSKTSPRPKKEFLLPEEQEWEMRNGRLLLLLAELAGDFFDDLGA